MKIPVNNQVIFIKNVVAVAAYCSCRLWRWVKMPWIHYMLCDHHWTTAGPSLAGPSTVAGPSPVAEPSTVAEPSPVAEPLPAGPSVTCAGPVTGTGTSTWSCRAGEEITVIVLFSGDNCTSRLATYECPVLSALSHLLSWWLGGDLLSVDAGDEADYRDLWLPDDW